ncbi:MAG TPA: protease modulator HflC [Candidatus Thioglobus sp.]|jgi:membrane protease subunit HflC|nr:protease modulator HflC [Candidatus Thioglobus sp.]HIL20763.1 protease modulator HflC [Candidatus Thioglobus sp.]
MKKISIISIVLIPILAILASSALYTVNETQVAIKLRLGEVVAIENEPGLKFKTPFVNNVVFFDQRIQTLDSAPEAFLTVEKKNVIVDSYVKWRIVDVWKFYISTGGAMASANLRLAQNNQDALRSEFSKRTIREVVSDQRDAIMATVKSKLKSIAESEYGIEVIDVRIKRIELSQEVRNSVYLRMETERKGLANKLRSEGSEEAEKIQAFAEKERTIILANAYRDSEKVRGEGDAESASNYAEAYSQDAEFYSFYRSLESYRKSFGQSGDILVLSPDSEFFRHFNPSFD